MKIFVHLHCFSQFCMTNETWEMLEDCRLFSELVDPTGKNFFANLKYLSTSTN